MSPFSTDRSTKGEPIRVGWVVTPLSPYGGTLHHLHQWLEGLRAVGTVEPELFYFSPDEWLHGPSSHQQRPPSDPLPCHHIKALDLHRRAPLSAARALAAALKHRRIEIIHTLFIGSDLIGLLAAKLTRLPIVSSIEGDLLVRDLSPFWRTALGTSYRALSRQFGATTAISEASAQAARSVRSSSAVPIEILHPGTPFAPARAFPTLEHGLQLVTLGRIAPIKGLPLLVEAVARLRARHPKLRVTIIGDGPDREPLNALIHSRGVADAFDITGWLPHGHAMERLSGAHILIQPSYSEGIPWSVLEAMARGIPVVAADVGGVGEVIPIRPEPDRIGYLIPPNRSDLLTIALGKLLDRGDLATHLAGVGERAREHIRRFFQSKQEVQKLVRIYQYLRGKGW